MARRDAAVSVEKYGFPVPAANLFPDQHGQIMVIFRDEVANAFLIVDMKDSQLEIVAEIKSPQVLQELRLA